MRIVTVPMHGNPHKTARMEDGATVGATLGKNFYSEDGMVLTLASLRTALDIPPPESGITPTAWSLILDIPPNVTALETAVGTGLFAVTGAGTGAFRALTATAGETTVANGDGVAGNPTVGLANVADAGGGTLLKTVFDGKGRKTGSSAATTSDLAEGSNLYFTDARAVAAVSAVPLQLVPYTLGTLPAVTPAWRMIAVTDLTGGAEPCFSDGTNWRRCSDRSIAS